MEAGQRFYSAIAGYSTGAYAVVCEHECVGSTAGVVVFKPSYTDRVDSIAERDAYLTREEAKAACIAKLRSLRDQMAREIDAEIAKLESQS